jgi:hypothetical protein
MKNQFIFIIILYFSSLHCSEEKFSYKDFFARSSSIFPDDLSKDNINLYASWLEELYLFCQNYIGIKTTPPYHQSILLDCLKEPTYHTEKFKHLNKKDYKNYQNYTQGVLKELFLALKTPQRITEKNNVNKIVEALNDIKTNLSYEFTRKIEETTTNQRRIENALKQAIILASNKND